ncbi:radical SAM/SPASM domain-containing protein [Patescibacteria group bacterium]
MKIHLELSNVCNFSCSFCPKPTMVRKVGFIDSDFAKKAMDEISSLNPPISEFFFNQMGEPLMHPQIFDLIGYALKRKLPLAFYTNGSLFSEKNIQGLIKANMAEMNISVQTPTEKTFPLRNAKSIDYQTYKKQIVSAVIQIAKGAPQTKIKLCVLATGRNFLSRRFWLTKDSIHIIDTKEQAKGIISSWVKDFRAKNANVDMPSILEGLQEASIDRNFEIKLFDNVYFTGTTFFDWNTFEDAKDPRFKKAKFGSCDGFQEQAVIHWNGSVTSCCVDYESANSIGNLHKESLVNIFNSPKAKDFVKKLRMGVLPTPYCQICRGSTSTKTWLSKQLGSVLFFNLKPHRQRRKKKTV